MGIKTGQELQLGLGLQEFIEETVKCRRPLGIL